jgi:3'-5' exoribonuclease
MDYINCTIEKAMGLQNNVYIKGSFAVSELTLKPFKEKDGSFLTFILQDKTGRMFGKIWDDAEQALKGLSEGVIISLNGKINLFGGKNQIVVESYETIDEYNLSDFMICSSKSPNKMFQELLNIMKENLKDNDIKLLWDSYHDDSAFIKLFKTCPGGKGDVHHAYIHGLLEHTLSVVKNCLFFADQFKEQHVNKDYVLMGAFLHDLGKMRAYDYKISINMTDIGRLHGHVVLGYHSFLDKIQTISIEENKRNELIKVLGHLILSHHGKYEHEAVKLPMTQEAILLAAADYIDSEIFHVNKQLDVLSATEKWTPFDGMREKMYYLNRT